MPLVAMKTMGNSAQQRHLSTASIPLQARSLQAPFDGTPSVLHGVSTRVTIFFFAPFELGPDSGAKRDNLLRTR